MMKTTVAIACCIACLSCAKKPDVISLDNGYSFRREQITPGTVRWTLRRDTPPQPGVVAQAIVTGDTVISVLPTPVHYSSCIPTAYAGSDFFVVTQAGEMSLRLRLHRDGTFAIQDEAMDSTRFARTVERLRSFSTNLSAVLQIETPCQLTDFTNAVTRCAAIAGGGFGVTYKGSSRELEIEEIEEPVERKESPDIPIAFTNETAEPASGG